MIAVEVFSQVQSLNSALDKANQRRSVAIACFYIIGIKRPSLTRDLDVLLICNDRHQAERDLVNVEQELAALEKTRSHLQDSVTYTSFRCVISLYTRHQILISNCRLRS